MHVSDLTLRATVQTVRVGPVAYRVMRPVAALRGYLVDWQSCCTRFSSGFDMESFRALVFAWAFAARSPRTIVYLPVIDDPRIQGGGAGSRVNHDLVLVHHSLQLAASQWKTVRSRLGPGHPETLALSPSAYPAGDSTADRVGRYFSDNKDLLRYQVAARTLLIAGSKVAFESDMPRFREMVETGAATLATNPFTSIGWEIDLAGDVRMLVDVQQRTSAGR